MKYKFYADKFECFMLINNFIFENMFAIFLSKIKKMYFKIKPLSSVYVTKKNVHNDSVNEKKFYFEIHFDF